MAEESNESLGTVYIAVGADLTKLRSDMNAAKTEVASMAKDIAAAVTRAGKPVFGPDWAKNLARERAKVAANWGKSRSPEQEKEDQFLRDQIMSSVKKVGVIKGSQRGGMLDSMMGLDAQKGRAAPTAAELALYKQGEKDRGMALEKAMAREQKELQRAAAEEAKRSAKEAQTAWQVAQKAAADHAKVVAQRWKALGDYIKGDMMKLHGRSLWEDFSNGASKAFSIVGGAAKIVFAPMTLAFNLVKSLIPLLAMAGGLGVTLGGMAMKAAGGFEMLHARVKAMVGSEKEAVEVFAEASAVQRKYINISSNDAAMAIALMRSSGLRGKEVTEGLANMSAITQTTMTNAAQMMTSGRSYALRRYGIIQSREKEQMVVRFTMPSGQEVRLVGKTFTENIMNNLKAVGMKFAGAAVEAAKTLSGVWAGVKNAMSTSLQVFGKGLLPFGKAVGMQIVEWINKGIGSGKFEEWGKWIGEKLLYAFNVFVAGVRTLPTIIGEFQKMFSGSAVVLSRVLSSTFHAINAAIGDMLIIALEGTWNFWKAVGELIASIFRSTFLDTLSDAKIPIISEGAKSYRNKLLNEEASNVSSQYFKDIASYIAEKTKPVVTSMGSEGTYHLDPNGNVVQGEFTKIVKPEVTFQMQAEARKFAEQNMLKAHPYMAEYVKSRPMELFRSDAGSIGGEMPKGVESGLMTESSGRSLAVAIKDLRAIPVDIGKALADSWSKLKNTILDALEAEGFGTKAIEAMFDIMLKDQIAKTAELFKVEEGSGGGGGGGGSLAGGPVDVKSVGFADWVKTAQEDAMKKKQLGVLEKIEKNTRGGDGGSIFSVPSYTG